jgi:hypothetical protein
MSADCKDPIEIVRLTGSTENGTIYGSTTGFLQVIFKSDSSVTMSGFEVEWNVTKPSWHILHEVHEQIPTTTTSRNSLVGPFDLRIPDTNSSIAHTDCICAEGYQGNGGLLCEECLSGTYAPYFGSISHTLICASTATAAPWCEVRFSSLPSNMTLGVITIDVASTDVLKYLTAHIGNHKVFGDGDLSTTGNAGLMLTEYARINTTLSYEVPADEMDNRFATNMQEVVLSRQQVAGLLTSTELGSEGILTTTTELGLVYDGYIQVEVAGEYRFGISSDDSGDVAVDGLIVASQQSWGLNIVAGTPVILEAGLHSFRARCIQGGGSLGVLVFWQTPWEPFAFVQIPDSSFRTTNNGNCERPHRYSSAVNCGVLGACF